MQNACTSDEWNTMQIRNQVAGKLFVDKFYKKIRLCESLNLTFHEIRDHVVQGFQPWGIGNCQSMFCADHIATTTSFFGICPWGNGLSHYITFQKREEGLFDTTVHELYYPDSSALCGL